MTEHTGEVCVQLKIVLKAIVLLLGTISISTTAGYLVGRTENDTTIAAAVVTGLLGLLLGWIAYASKAKADAIETSILSSVGAVVFCVTFVIVMNLTISVVEQEDRVALEEELLLRHQFNLIHLQQCSELEFRINSQRDMVGLPKLSSEIVCGRQ